MLRMPGEAAATIDLTSLPAEVAALIERLQQQAQADAQELARREREIALARVKIDKLNFELARLKRWKFDAKTETMTAAQRLLFADTLAEDEASLQAKLAELQRSLPETPKTPKAPPLRPRRQALPEHLERVEHRHEPEDTTCPNADCGRPMQRIGEDVSEKLDIIPAKFFVHRHIYGKWACKCCQQLRQEPAEPDVVDGGIPAAGLVAHTLISRFVDHLPYYRQAPINARSGVHTPRSTLASWGGAGGVSLEPLCCTPTRRRCRCWTRAQARRRRSTSGPGRAATTIRTRAWSTSSAWDAGRSTRWPSWAARGRHRKSRCGTAP
jgi:transposase